MENKIIKLCRGSNWYDSTEQIHEQANLEMLKDRLLKISTTYLANITVDSLKVNTLYLEQPSKLNRFFPPEFSPNL